MILPTIGPVTSSYKNIKTVLSYSKFVRINGSHNQISWHKKICKIVKKIDKNSRILLDLPGIKPRTLNHSIINIKKNEIATFYFKKKPTKYIKNIHQIELSKKLPKIDNKKNFSISDGKYLFKTLDYGKNFIIGKSLSEFKLNTKQGLNIPNSYYDDFFQEKIYLQFLKKTNSIKFDAIGLSFVQNEKVIKRIKLKYPKKIIISKIENLFGLKNYKKIIDNSDAVMVDRGDLSAEIGQSKIYNSIIKISKYCKEKGIPIIIATDNLGTMMENLRPSNNDITSINFYNELGVDKIMLSEETAISKNWKKILQWLNNFLKTINHKTKDKKNFDFAKQLVAILNSYPNEIKIIFTKKGYILNKLNLSNTNNTHVFTDNEKLYTQNLLTKNINIYLTSKFNNNKLSFFIKKTIKHNLKDIFFKNNHALLLFVNNPRKNSRANTIQFVEKKDFE
jgi:pyruvate kinase